MTAILAVKTSAVKTAAKSASEATIEPTAKAAAAKTTTMEPPAAKAATVETTATTKAVRLGSANTDSRGKRDSDDGEAHRQSAGHETFLYTCHIRFVFGCLTP